MMKIVIVGCGCAGKSTFSRRLGEKLNIPVIHLDMYFWKPGWIETSPDQWRSKVQALCNQEQWIMDGNFSETADIRYAAADTIIFFDIPRVICLTRWFKRYLQFRKGGRPDMTEGCIEKPNFEYLKWLWNFPTKNKPKIQEQIRLYANNKKIIPLRSNKEIEIFFESIALAID